MSLVICCSRGFSLQADIASLSVKTYDVKQGGQKAPAPEGHPSQAAPNRACMMLLEQAHVLRPHLACCSAGTFRCASMAGAVMPCWLVRSSCKRPSRNSSAGVSALPAEHSHMDRVACLRSQGCTSGCTRLPQGRLCLPMHFTEVCSAVCSALYSCTRSGVQVCSEVCSCPRTGFACRCTQPCWGANLPGNSATNMQGTVHVSSRQLPTGHLEWRKLTSPTSFKGGPTRQLQSYYAQRTAPEVSPGAELMC